MKKFFKKLKLEPNKFFYLVFYCIFVKKLKLKDMRKIILVILLIGFVSCSTKKYSETPLHDTIVILPTQVYPDYEWTLVDGEIFVVTDFNVERDFYRGHFLHHQGESTWWNIKSKYVKPYTK